MYKGRKSKSSDQFQIESTKIFIKIKIEEAIQRKSVENFIQIGYLSKKIENKS
jgi:hypothetical protein